MDKKNALGKGISLNDKSKTAKVWGCLVVCIINKKICCSRATTFAKRFGFLLNSLILQR
jgi:hypothetical protein